MFRHIGTLAAAGLIATALVATPASPASAHNTGICVGQGTATTGALFYPGFGYTTPEIPPTPRTVGYSLTLHTGVCLLVMPGAVEPAPSAQGTLTGWCGLSTGTGVTAHGHVYAHLEVGSFVVITAEPHIYTAVGLVNVVPDVTAGQSCVTGATSFLVIGVVVLI